MALARRATGSSWLSARSPADSAMRHVNFARAPFDKGAALIDPRVAFLADLQSAKPGTLSLGART